MGTQAGILASMLLDAKEGGSLIWPIKMINHFTMPYEAATGDMVIKVVFDGVGGPCATSNVSALCIYDGS